MLTYQPTNALGLAPGVDLIVADLQRMAAAIVKYVGERAARIEQDLYQRGYEMSWLARRGALTCRDIDQYNKDAERLYRLNVKFYNILVRAELENVPTVPAPRLWTMQKSGGARILTLGRTYYDRVTCPSGRDIPEFDIVQHDPEPGALGVAPVVGVLVVWGARIVATVVAGIMLIFVIQALRDLVHGTEKIQQEYNEFARDLGNDILSAVAACIEKAEANARAAGVPFDYLAARAQCDESVRAAFPEVRRPEGSSWIRSLLFIGLGLGAVFGGVAIYRAVRDRGGS